MYHTALKMARQVAEPTTRPWSAYELMVAAGKMRMDAARKGPEGKGHSLASKVTLRCDEDMPAASMTPLMGKYGYLWNVTLGRRHREGRAIFFEPEPSSRTRLCGVYVTFATMPLERCHAVQYPILGDATKQALAVSAGSRHPSHWDPGWATAGVSRVNGKCRVVINRAIARSGTDGILLGENCYSFYGANSQVPTRRDSILSHGFLFIFPSLVWRLDP